MSDPASQALLKAADYVESGWCRYTWAKDAQGERVMSHTPEAARWSAGGAVTKAVVVDVLPGADLADQKDLADRAIKRLVESLRLPTEDPLLEVTMWNDTAGRTGKEVAMKMRAAA